MVFTDLDQENPFGEFDDYEVAKQDLQTELVKIRREREEINRKIQQSQVEANKLTKRNAAINAQMQQFNTQLDNFSKEDIRGAYDSALDAQQRLFVMRGQLEKLQSELNTIDKFIDLLNRAATALEQGEGDAGSESRAFETVEMMIQAQEDERRRLSRQMHDGPAQALSNFILQTEIAARLFDVDPSKARDELGVLKNAATTTFQKVRDFIFELRPMMLDDLGLIPTIKRYFETVKEQTSAEMDLVVTGADRRFESHIEVVVFRSVQELLRNAIDHSQGSEIKVQLDAPEREIRVSVDDNGKGFDPEVVNSQQNMGLRLIKERVELLGGVFEVDTVIGKGSRISYSVPIQKMPDLA